MATSSSWPLQGPTTTNRSRRQGPPSSTLGEMAGAVSTFLQALLDPSDAERQLIGCFEPYEKRQFRVLDQCLETWVENHQSELETDTQKRVGELQEFDAAAELLRNAEGPPEPMEASQFSKMIVGLLTELREIRIRGTCYRFGINEDDIPKVQDTVKSLVEGRDPHKIRLNPLRLGCYDRWCERVAQEQQAQFQTDIRKAWTKLGRILYPTTIWRDQPFRFFDLPSELRMRIYELAIPDDTLRRVRCLLWKHQVDIVTSAFPSLPTLPCKGSEWNYDFDTVKSMLRSCPEIANEVAPMFFRQRKHEISVLPNSVYWLESKHKLLNDESRDQKSFALVRYLQVTIYTGTASADIDKATKHIEHIVALLHKQKELRSLDIIFIPLPQHGNVRRSLPLDEIMSMLRPFKTLHGVQKASVRLGMDSENKSESCAWALLSEPPGATETLHWILPNDSSRIRWEEMKKEVVDELLRSKADAESLSGTLETLELVVAAPSA